MSVTTAVNEFKIESLTQKWSEVLKFKDFIMECTIETPEHATVIRGDVNYQVNLRMRYEYSITDGLFGCEIVITKITGSDGKITDEIKKNIHNLIVKKYNKMGCYFNDECDSECDSECVSDN